MPRNCSINIENFSKPEGPANLCLEKPLVQTEHDIIRRSITFPDATQKHPKGQTEKTTQNKPFKKTGGVDSLIYGEKKDKLLKH